jgi:superfamily II DNA/RNA helicase
VVVFSQWETMVFEAAKVLDGLGVGYTVLHGGLPGKDRKEVLEKFKSDPGCRVFLSTDAGGTGLNLQVADTVVNLELPWNPAVLEQRIARVHRMGQSRPVRVINFVTRGTIEERVLRTLEAKQGLFSGIFEGDEDEIPFEAVNTSGFLDAVRELIGERTRGPKPEAGEQKPERDQKPPPSESGSRPPELWAAVAHLLEGVSLLLRAGTRDPVPDDVRDRVRSAVADLTAALNSAQVTRPASSG